ncbi:hypothetical protein SNE40_021598 [Patella caerulea]|uniref:Testicular haploid expressed protein n=2 Tax=Patella caerulea TaxID=87958 RepID=A0AAN8GBF3_PATCE
MADTKGMSRIEVLARPKTVPQNFQEDRRSVYWVDRKPLRTGPNGTTTIEVSDRVAELSKNRDPNPNYQFDKPTPIWEVKPGALRATASARVTTLAQHRDAHQNHQMERSPYTDITDGAKKAKLSQRVEDLAIPKSRVDRYDVNETQWGQRQPVSDAAKKAVASERVEALAEAKPYHSNFQHAKPIMWEVSDLAIKALASLRLQQLSRPRSRTMIKDDYDPYEVSRGARRARPTPRVEELSVPLPRKTREKKVV